jgi:hypothetical protein
MWYTLTVDGIPVGRVNLTNAPRGVGQLIPLTAFDTSGLRAAARRLGLALRVLGARSIPASVSARALTGALQESLDLRDRLGLVDISGSHAAVIDIVVVEFPRDHVPLVVARLREQAAPRGATLRVTPGEPGHRSRPAA